MYAWVSRDGRQPNFRQKADFYVIARRLEINFPELRVLRKIIRALLIARTSESNVLSSVYF